MTSTPPPPPPPQGAQPGAQGSQPGPQPGPPQGPPAPAPAGQGTGVDAFFDAIRRAGVVRTEERWVGGVAGGVALRLGIDPLVVRGLLALTALLGGIGLVLYGLAWALLPEQRDGRIHLQELFRGHFDIAVLGAFVVFATGLSFPDRWNPGIWWSGGVGDGWWRGVLWLSAVAVVVVLIVSAVRDRNRHRTPPPGGFPPPPGGYPPPAGPPPTTPPLLPSHGTSTTMPTDNSLDSTQPIAPGPETSGMVAAQDATPEHPTAQHPTEQYPNQQYPTQQYPTQQYPAAAAYPAQQYPAGQQYPTGQPYAGQQYSAQPYAGQQYSGQQYYGGGTTPPAPPATVAARRPSGPGAATVGVVVALTLLTLAGLMYAERTDAFDGPVLLIAGSVGVVLAGLGIIVAGLRGRTSGALGGLAVLGIIVLLPLSVVARADLQITGSGTAVGDVRTTPTTITEAEEGYSLGAGEARIDLTELPASTDTVVVPINVGAGEVTVIMPADGAYSADVRIFAGEIEWLGDSVSRAGGGRFETFESDAVADGAEPDIDLQITVGAGTVRVEEER